MTKELTADFVDEVKADLSRRDPVQRRLTLASYELDDSHAYFFAAMKAVAPHMRDILASIMAHGADGDDPGVPAGQRAQAAYWFLSGSNAGYWTATPQETEASRILIVIAGFAMPEKTKADLAREAGLPTKDTVIVKPAGMKQTTPDRPTVKPTPTPKSASVNPAKAKAVSKEDLRRYAAMNHEHAAMAKVLDNPQSTGAAKLAAIDKWFSAMDYLTGTRLTISLEPGGKILNPQPRST